MPFALSSMTLSSPAFGSGQLIPRKYSGEGDNVSPALLWEQAPRGTRAFALFCHDPDAPLVQHGGYGFVHWVLYNLPAETTHVTEASTAGTPGVNDFGLPGYGGPMPPEGHGAHHYYFWVLALDVALDLPAGLRLDELLARVEPHLLGMNRLVGCYRRE